jgi:AbrB family looped-hinge helix DNA binding protein
MRITTKGQVTIPLEVRERLNLLPHTEVRFRVEGQTAVIEKLRSTSDRGASLIRHLRGSATLRLTTDEILALTRDPASGTGQVTGRGRAPRPRRRAGG